MHWDISMHPYLATLGPGTLHYFTCEQWFVQLLRHCSVLPYLVHESWLAVIYVQNPGVDGCVGNHNCSSVDYFGQLSNFKSAFLSYFFSVIERMSSYLCFYQGRPLQFQFFLW